MSTPFLSLPLDRIRDDAQSLLGRATAHEHHLETLARRTDIELMDAEAALSAALNDGDRVLQLRDLLRSQVQRCFETAADARRLCLAAHAQRGATARMLAHLYGDDSADESCSTLPRSEVVLVVDDNDDVRELLSVVLQSAGFVVRTAVNGLEGLFAAYEMQPAVIVMDLAMPVLDGIEATRLIKAAKATRDARVIAYTGSPSLGDGLFPGLFAAVLEKPAAPEVVLSTVHRFVSA